MKDFFPLKVWDKNVCVLYTQKNTVTEIKADGWAPSQRGDDRGQRMVEDRSGELEDRLIEFTGSE